MSPRREPDPDRRGRNVGWNLHDHLVFLTNYRQGMFNNTMLTTSTHSSTHPPTFALSRLVNSLKGVSSRRPRREHLGQINRTHTRGRVWAPSSIAASCRGAPLDVVKEYIRGQQRPDRSRTCHSSGPAGPGTLALTG